MYVHYHAKNARATLRVAPVTSACRCHPACPHCWFACACASEVPGWRTNRSVPASCAAVQSATDSARPAVQRTSWGWWRFWARTRDAAPVQSQSRRGHFSVLQERDSARKGRNERERKPKRKGERKSREKKRSDITRMMAPGRDRSNICSSVLLVVVLVVVVVVEVNAVNWMHYMNAPTVLVVI